MEPRRATAFHRPNRSTPGPTCSPWSAPSAGSPTTSRSHRKTRCAPSATYSPIRPRLTRTNDGPHLGGCGPCRVGQPAVRLTPAPDAVQRPLPGSDVASEATVTRGSVAGSALRLARVGSVGLWTGALPGVAAAVARSGRRRIGERGSDGAEAQRGGEGDGGDGAFHGLPPTAGCLVRPGRGTTTGGRRGCRCTDRIRRHRCRRSLAEAGRRRPALQPKEAPQRRRPPRPRDNYVSS